MIKKTNEKLFDDMSLDEKLKHIADRGASTSAELRAWVHWKRKEAGVSQDDLEFALCIERLIEALETTTKALNQIADPRKRPHQEPDAYTQLGCVMSIASEALAALGEDPRSGQ